jgi:hypothetical protein
VLLLALSTAVFPMVQRFCRVDIPALEFSAMIASRPVAIGGRFVGVAVAGPSGWHFKAIDPVVDDLEGARFSSPAEAARVAGLVVERARRHDAAAGTH